MPRNQKVYPTSQYVRLLCYERSSRRKMGWRRFVRCADAGWESLRRDWVRGLRHQLSHKRILRCTTDGKTHRRLRSSDLCFFPAACYCYYHLLLLLCSYPPASGIRSQPAVPILATDRFVCMIDGLTAEAATQQQPGRGPRRRDSSPRPLYDDNERSRWRQVETDAVDWLRARPAYTCSASRLISRTGLLAVATRKRLDFDMT